MGIAAQAEHYADHTGLGMAVFTKGHDLKSEPCQLEYLEGGTS